MSRQLDNDNPTIFAPTAPATSSRRKSGKALLWDERADEFAFDEGDEGSEDGSAGGSGGEGGEREEIDAEEVFDLLRSITDPEHPVSLEQLRVVNPDDIYVSGNRVLVYLTPTIPHCSMSTLIGKLAAVQTTADELIKPGLSLRVRLMRSLPPRFRVDIRIKEGTHQSEHAVNKQLNDKERVQAALENQHLLQVVEGCLATAGKRGREEAEHHH